ncbi:MAG TPA: acetyl-CoA hydrolase/transferase C-terminal domain-containing protein [Syntrophomonadaceae bacterium]|nr:acetyl-CoA hydrolase/transferase C-terminal domain-containing protein [Syntrophomonadaceae bacterium]HQE23445.1 acetyl-CoA hydrolase/transferase C-terminal domain-containing protein [Syntrophomonadaceae bacterium]
MSWQEYYNSRIITADDAIKLLKKGDLVINGHGTGEPQLLPEALVRNQDSVEGIVVAHGIALGPSVYCGEDVDPKHVEHLTVFAGTHTRKAIKEQRARFVPMHFSDCPIAMRNGIIKVDVAWTQVSPPDKHGFCTFGISCDYERAAVETARLVVAEVNPNMPRTFGDTLIHVSQIDYFVLSDRPLIEMKKPAIGSVESTIGKYVADLVEDGATMQFGMGGIPNAIVGFLKEKNDLGINSELFSDGAMELMISGNVTNKYKKVHPGKSTTTFAAGTKELYEWLDNNPAVEFYPVDYLNNSYVIAQNDKVFSVNSALQIDLQGQVAAETINGTQFSGIGGQMDFVRGATWSKGGKSVIALPSTAKGGTISRIVSTFKPGDAVTTPRNDVDYVITEYGVAHLRGKDMQERARLLISIAAPEFRDQLREEYQQIYKYKL